MHAQKSAQMKVLCTNEEISEQQTSHYKNMQEHEPIFNCLQKNHSHKLLINKIMLILFFF